MIMCGFLKPKIPAPPKPPPVPAPPPPTAKAREPRAPRPAESPEEAGLDAAALGHRRNRRLGAGAYRRPSKNPLA